MEPFSFTAPFSNNHINTDILEEYRMSAITFELLRKAWDKLTTQRVAELKKLSPNLSDIEKIYLKAIDDGETSMAVQFGGFEKAVDNSQFIPQVKRMILIWLRKIAMDVRTMRSDTDSMIVLIDKESKLGEAVISVYKRDPKTNRRKDYFKCIGGKKSGRKVSSPDGCMGVPAFDKKVKMSLTKRAKAGTIGKERKKTQLTNIVHRKIRKANQRLKKARGF